MRWRHITRLTGVLSRDVADHEDNRLYPAFFYVELRFPESRPLGSFGENDTLVVMVYQIKRYGLSMLDGTVYMIPPESRHLAATPLASLDEAEAAGIPAVRMSNAFVMKFDGAEWLKKSRPRSGILDRVVELPSPPDSFHLCKQVQQGGTLGDTRNFRAVHDAEVTFQYAIQPDRDVNGAGLLYFTNYPLFLDPGRAACLEAGGPPWSDAVINTRSLLVRTVVYLNNAAWNDSMEIRTRSEYDSRRSAIVRRYDRRRNRGYA